MIRRVWENVAEYQVELMASVAREESNGDIEFGVRTVGPMIAAIDRSTPEARMAGMREICRVGGDLYAHTVQEPGTWPLWIGVWALVANGESGQYCTIRAALLDGYETFTQQTESLWAALVHVPRIPIEEAVRSPTLCGGAELPRPRLRASPAH